MRLNRILGRGTSPSADTRRAHADADSSLSAPDIPEGNNPTFSLPGWALAGRDRRLITRKRLIIGGSVLAVLLFLFWLNYPFMPNYRILLFHRPTTEASSGATAGRWAMAGGDLAQRKVAHAAVGSESLPTGRVRWTVDTGEGTRAGPIVADGVVYQGAYFRILALDAETGDTVWSQPASGPVQGTLALAGGTLYAGFLDHHVRALDPGTGEMLWEFRTGDIITASPVVADGILYVGAWDNLQYALDAATGEVIWTYAATDKISSHAPLADGIMAVADKAGRINLLDARTGQNRLVYRTPRSTNAAPVIAHDRVYFAAGGRIYAIDATAKEVPGQYQFKRVWAQFWLWQVPGVPRPAGQQGGLWRFSPDGDDSTIVASPAVANTRLYVGDLDGRLYAVDPVSGREQWRFETEGGVYASPVGVRDVVYVATQAGYVYAVDAESGEELWHLTLDAAVNEPMAFAEGVLYLRTADGAVVAIE